MANGNCLRAYQVKRVTPRTLLATITIGEMRESPLEFNKLRIIIIIKCIQPTTVQLAFLFDETRNIVGSMAEYRLKMTCPVFSKFE